MIVRVSRSPSIVDPNPIILSASRQLRSKVWRKIHKLHLNGAAWLVLGCLSAHSPTTAHEKTNHFQLPKHVDVQLLNQTRRTKTNANAPPQTPNTHRLRFGEFKASGSSLCGVTTIDGPRKDTGETFGQLEEIRQQTHQENADLIASWHGDSHLAADSSADFSESKSF